MTEAERNLLRLTASLAGILLGNAAGEIPNGEIREMASGVELELRKALKRMKAEGAPGSQRPV